MSDFGWIKLSESNSKTSSQLKQVPHLPLIHRDLSWLHFNERVLAEAKLRTNPILERLKFLSISSSNLDEFFVIRFPSLLKSIQDSTHAEKTRALNLLRIKTSILNSVQGFTKKQSEILSDLQSQLKSHQIYLGQEFTADSVGAQIQRRIFLEEILPLLPKPEPFNPAYIGSLESLQMAVVIQEGFWMRIPTHLPPIFCRWNEITQELYCFFLDQLLMKYMGDLFGVESTAFMLRITRDGDFSVQYGNDDTESIPDHIRLGLGKREHGKPSRLQILGRPSKKMLQEFLKSLNLSSHQVLETPSTLCLHGLCDISRNLPSTVSYNTQLSHLPLKSMIPHAFRRPEQIFEILDREDLLLHHPYDSFECYIQWLKAACEDPQVIQIEQTVYRTDAISPIMDALKVAAQSKTIKVIIELRARFDELNNLRLADELKRAGVHVSFGSNRLKLHGKVTLITRQKADGSTQRYAHLSTGNYKAATARLYTDLAILTSHPDICADVRHFFDRIWGGQIPQDFKQLVPAPAKLHRRLLAHIEHEIQTALKGRPARIFAKVNALVDDTVIQHLYRASQAGVQIDLIVRGACSLVPGVRGLSENIRVISIVDRFLEHSRIYYFGDAQVIYLSSADWMPRNFFSRLEIAFPVLDPALYRYIEQVVIPISLGDTAKARFLSADGKWKRQRPESFGNEKKPLRSQFIFEELALREYKGTPLWKKGIRHEQHQGQETHLHQTRSP